MNRSVGTSRQCALARHAERRLEQISGTMPGGGSIAWRIKARSGFGGGAGCGSGFLVPAAITLLGSRNGTRRQGGTCADQQMNERGLMSATGETVGRGENVQRIGVIGLGSMGMGMARRLVGAGFRVAGYDVREEAGAALAAAGGGHAASPAEAAAQADILLVMVVNAAQVDAVLFGTGGAAAALPRGAVVMLSVTVPPSFAAATAKRLEASGHLMLDAPVSGGAVGATNGTLTVMGSGPEAAFAKAEAALAAVAGKIYRLGEAAGVGSTVKTVNQLLAGIHIAAAAEAMALGVRAGADARALYEVISNSAGASWMFGNRVPHMLAGDYTPLSAVDIFVKDLGLVLDTGRELRFPLPLAGAAHQLFLMAAAAGLGREDDSAVVKVYEKLAGITVGAAKS
jgi:L-threonate 2-dehydrogenase